MNAAEIHIIVAMSRNHLIGYNGNIPWHLSEDLRLFKELTLGATVIMGSKTFESIGAPLPGRTNIVVSSRSLPVGGIQTCSSFHEALAAGRKAGQAIFCIGGAEIYRAALPLADVLHISWVEGDYEGDTFFPAFDLNEWQESGRQHFTGFTHATYQRKRGQV